MNSIEDGRMEGVDRDECYIVGWEGLWTVQDSNDDGG